MEVRNSRLGRKGGFSLVEVMIAMAIGAMALAGAFLLDSHQLRLVKSTRESGAASMSLEERVEQLRIATWRQITDPAFLTGKYFLTVPRSIAPLDGFTELVTVTAWPDAEACTPLSVEKKKNAQATVISDGSGLDDQRLAKVDVQITWRSSQGRVRTRELATIISNGGISRMNLPAMGNVAGAPPATTPAPENTDDPTEATTPAPAATPVVESSSATPVPAAATPKGWGRGNVGGKPGKA